MADRIQLLPLTDSATSPTSGVFGFWGGRGISTGSLWHFLPSKWPLLIKSHGSSINLSDPLLVLKCFFPLNSLIPFVVVLLLPSTSGSSLWGFPSLFVSLYFTGSGSGSGSGFSTLMSLPHCGRNC